MAQWVWLSCIKYSLFHLLKSPIYYSLEFQHFICQIRLKLLENFTFNSVLRFYIFKSTIFSHIFFIVVLFMKSNYVGNIYFSHLLICMEVYGFLLITGFLKRFWDPVDFQCCSRTILQQYVRGWLRPKLTTVYRVWVPRIWAPKSIKVIKT